MKYAFDFDELYRLVGSICVHATWLEHELEDTVAELTRSDQVAPLVQGERGTQLVRWIKRLVDNGAIEGEHAAELKALAGHAEKLLKTRDQVVHTLWMKRNQSAPGDITGTRTTWVGSSSTEWSLEKLAQLRQDLADAQTDVFDVTWNAFAEEKGNALMARRGQS